MNTKRTVGTFIFILLLGVGYVVYKNVPIKNVEIVQNVVPPTFSWKTEKSSELNLDGLPKTIVSLEATYPDGSIMNKRIDISDGGCNSTDMSDKNSFPGTTIFQCYAAGFGHHYIIVKGDKSYLVQRQEFEEGLPDITPPVREYEVISEFPISNK